MQIYFIDTRFSKKYMTYRSILEKTDFEIEVFAPKKPSSLKCSQRSVNFATDILVSFQN